MTPYMLQNTFPRIRSHLSRLTTSRGCSIFDGSKPRVCLTSYEVADLLPLVPRRILRVDSLGRGLMPSARRKSGEIASSSEPESQHVYAFTPFIVTRAGRPCRNRCILVMLAGMLRLTFEFEAQSFWELALICWAVLPMGRGLMPLPRDS